MRKSELLFVFLFFSSGFLSIVDGIIGVVEELPWTDTIVRFSMGFSSIALVVIYILLQKNLDLLIFLIISFGINMISTFVSVINILSSAETFYHNSSPINYNLNVIATGFSGVTYLIIIILGSYLSQGKKKD
jgi:hypothetical protein